MYTLDLKPKSKIIIVKKKPKKLNLWLLTTAINSPHLIDRKDRRAVDGLGLSFENKLLAASQQWIANLTFGHKQVAVFNAQQSNPECPLQISELESDAATNQRGLIAKD